MANPASIGTGILRYNALFCYRFNALLHRHSLGNFKQLARAVTADPAMLRYLNGYANAKKAPDENYGRELQELFAVGKGPGSHYTESDVKDAARVLTAVYRVLTAVYSTLLEKWFRASEPATASILFKDYTTLPLIA